MQSWHNTYLGLHELPRDISTFELQMFSPTAVLSASSLRPAGAMPSSWALHCISAFCA